ncbi:PH domain-containing protein [Cellulomonas sp. KH9]|uniref:PH domain-containing protein n=1 Tax=Cellulomonas sp. KH9 TaxID=1855324 RepID=UPI0008E80889|nr:PH domain-containing protein [Cellulomonas sp. KH9]SFK20140.1 PH domain-containing protein [Cellulomonas sp. KH9]
MTADHATRIVMSHRLLRRYVLPGERVVLATRRHWAKLLEPAATTLAVFAVCGWLTAVLQPRVGDGALVVWWLWLAALARFAWYLLVWRVEWFVATDKRMLLLTGLVTHQIGMMPLMKVTDMRYSRSVLGQMLGYGQFLLESAGQDQALRQIGWVARPDATYRDLCALIFTPVTAPASDGEDDGGPAPRARRRPEGRPPAVPPARRVPRPEGGVALADAPAQAPSGTRSGTPSGVRPAAPDVPGAPEEGAPPRWVEPVVVWPSREDPFEPDDTRPLRLRTPDETDDPDVTSPEDAEPARRLPPTLAEAAADGTALEAEAIAGEEALRLDEEEAEQRSWDVSEPTGTFVDLGRRGWSEDTPAQPSPDPSTPPAGPAPDIEGNPGGGRT